MSVGIFRLEDAVPSWSRLGSLLTCQHIQQKLIGDKFAPREANLEVVVPLT